MGKETLESRFTALLEDYQWREWPALLGQTNDIRCGVLLPTVFSNDIAVYAGVRSSGLEKHAGEICFPGGRPEACDYDLRATALREANEEMGISEARILGRLSSMPLYTSNHCLEPYVGAIDSMKPKADGNELVRVLEVSMRDIGRSHINALLGTTTGSGHCLRFLSWKTASCLEQPLTCFTNVGLSAAALGPPMSRCRRAHTWPDILESTKQLPSRP